LRKKKNRKIKEILDDAIRRDGLLESMNHFAVSLKDKTAPKLDEETIRKLNQ